MHRRAELRDKTGKPDPRDACVPLEQAGPKAHMNAHLMCYVVVLAAITKCHRPHGLNYRKLFSRGWEVQDRGANPFGS